MKKIINLLSLIIISISAPICAFSDETKVLSAENVKKLIVSNSKGEIQISSSSSAKKILVTLSKIKFDKQCQFNIGESLGVLSIKVEHQNGIFDKADCVSKLKIEIPTKLIDLDVTTGTGQVTINNIEGAIDFKTATGTVFIKGDVLRNINGKTATGDIQLLFNKCSSRADIDLVSATGDAVISLPSQCKIKVRHKSATGELFNELGESEDYLITIASKSAGGSLKIKKFPK